MIFKKRASQQGLTISNRCYTSSTVTAGGGWRASLSAIHDQVFLIGDTSGNRVDHGSRRISCISRKVKTRHAAIHYLFVNNCSHKSEREHERHKKKEKKRQVATGILDFYETSQR